jgi:conjugative relaxase-like TrwC/TraI family protein
MMTFRVGAAASPTVSGAIAEYYLTDTLNAESVRAAEYYVGREERIDGFWHREVIDGRLEMRQHRAELRRDISPELAVRLALDDRPLTHARVANLLSLKTADGDPIEGRKKHSAGADGKRPPVGFIDLTLSAPKSLSVAWALASTADEREQLLGIHRTAVEKTMQYVAEEIGHTRRGGKNNRWTEPGDIAWIGFHHYTARPVGQDAADPQIHTHNIVLPHVLTESGHIGALDLDQLNGRIKEFGYVYQAYLGTQARKLGIRVDVDKRTHTIRFPDIPEHIEELFSKRTKEALKNADAHAARMGLDWREL